MIRKIKELYIKNKEINNYLNFWIPYNSGKLTCILIS